MIVDRIENWQRYFRGDSWRKAFEFLTTLTPDTSDGATEIQGRDIHARVMSYETVSEEQAKIEAHREHIDIQMSLVRDERIDWFPLKGLVAAGPYDPERDVTFFQRPGPAPAQIAMRPGMFAVLYPEDAHMPKVATGKPHHMKKVVVKLRLTLG